MSRNPLAETAARRRTETEDRYLARWQIAAYEAILYSSVIGSAWLDSWLSGFLRQREGAVLDIISGFAALGNSKWYLVTAGCWIPACLLLARMSADAALKERLHRLLWGLGWLVAAVAVSGILANFFKWLFGRARPSVLAEGETAAWTLFGSGWTHESFPSGHATTLFAVAFVAAAIFPRLRWWFWSLAVLGAMGRVAAGHHFLSDVIAGALLGGFVAWWLGERFPRLRAETPMAPAPESPAS